MTRRKAPTTPADLVPAQKLFAPSQGNRVERRSILQRVFGEQAAGVVILQAPAGHGKSMALGQIKLACESRGIASAWLNLDESDNDSRRHANHLRALLSQLTGVQAPADRGADASEHSRRPPQRADWLIDAMAQTDHEIALFFDEFEVITDRSILTFWRDFLARRPPSVRVFIATRAVPELGLARLLVGDRVLLLTADDLRFSRYEVHAFFGQDAHVELHPAEIETIYRRSEGWPAALQLFRLGLSNPETRRMLGALEHSRPRELAEYLTESVLAGQSGDVRDFLLRTSILVRLTAPLCNLLTGRQDGQQMLVRLERAGLFVRALDTERHWFRYHALFASLLVDQLAEIHPGAVIELHHRAARWLWEGGHFEDAMHHAVASRDVSLAVDIFRQWSSRLVASGEMATIGRWLDQLPKEQIDRDWALTIRVVWALTFLHRPTKLVSHLRALESLRALRAEGDGDDDSTTVRAVAAMCADRVVEARDTIMRSPDSNASVEGFQAFEQAAAENLRAYLDIFQGDLAAAHLHLTRARSFNQLGEATFSGGYTACFEGALLVLEGRVRLALECLREGIERQRSVLDSSFVSAALASCYIWALYEANDLEMMEAVAEEYRDMLPDAAVPDFFAVGQICISRVHLLRARDEEAVLVLEQAQYVATCNGWSRLVAMFELEKRACRLRSTLDAPGHGRRSRRAGKMDGHAIDLAATSTWNSPGSELLTSTRILLGNPIGDTDAPAAESAAPRFETAYRELHKKIERSLRDRAAGRSAAALRGIKQALGMVVKTGLIRPLLDHGSAVAELLRDYVDADPQAAQTEIGALASRLLSEFQGAPHAGPAQPSPFSLTYAAFTGREREVLGLLSRRLSNKEIARRTLLSENTVKFHLKNVFTKLGVSSRLEAYAAIVRLELSKAHSS